MDIGNALCTDPTQIANHFNDFFSSVADITLSKVPPTKTNFEDFPFNAVNSEFSFRPINANIIKEIISNLEPKSSIDINGFSPKLLKLCCEEILRPLTHLVNLSLTTGTFPNELKISRICPIFKSGCRKDVTNYRPVLSKVFEKVVYSFKSKLICGRMLP